MGLSDFVKGESAVVAAVTAAAVSPEVRGAVRKGAVYGVAGVLKAGDIVAAAARGAARGVQGAAAGASGDGAPPAEPTAAPTPARTRRATRASGA